MILRCAVCSRNCHLDLHPGIKLIRVTISSTKKDEEEEFNSEDLKHLKRFNSICGMIGFKHGVAF